MGVRIDHGNSEISVVFVLEKQGLAHGCNHGGPQIPNTNFLQVAMIPSPGCLENRI